MISCVIPSSYFILQFSETALKAEYQAVTRKNYSAVFVSTMGSIHVKFSDEREERSNRAFRI